MDPRKSISILLLLFAACADRAAHAPDEVEVDVPPAVSATASATTAAPQRPFENTSPSPEESSAQASEADRLDETKKRQLQDQLAEALRKEEERNRKAKSQPPGARPRCDKRTDPLCDL